jgi:hypothetical protein
VLAAGPENLAVMTSAAPVPGDSVRYSVSFPLRPGATKFAFNYDLPYQGRATFPTTHAYPLQQLAVMIPPTMKFSSPSMAFKILKTGNPNYEVRAISPLTEGSGPGFEISGVGALPLLQAQAQSPAKSLATPAAPGRVAPGNSTAQSQAANALPVGPYAAVSARSSELQWLGLSASTVLVLATCGFVLWRRQRLSVNAVTTVNAMTTAVKRTEQPERSSASLAEALTEELFQLEVDRFQGTLSGAEYDSARQAIDETIGWALGAGADRRMNTER